MSMQDQKQPIWTTNTLRSSQTLTCIAYVKGKYIYCMQSTSPTSILSKEQNCIGRHCGDGKDKTTAQVIVGGLKVTCQMSLQAQSDV
jgi:hypothetical protein